MRWFLVSVVLLYSGRLQAQTQPALPQKIDSAVPDSSLLLNLGAARIGNYTFAYRNSVTGLLKLPKGQRISYFAANDHVFNKILLTNPYVSKSIYLQFNHFIPLKGGLSAGHSLNLTDLGATGTRLSYYMPYLQLTGKAGSRVSFFSLVRAGVVTDKRINYTNSGPGAEALASWTIRNSDSTLHTHFFTRFGQNNISPRRNNYGAAGFSADKYFNKYANLQAGASFTSRTVQDYQGISDSATVIQSIRSDTLSVYLNLHYSITPYLSVHSSNRYQMPNRHFDYLQYKGPDTRVNIFYKQQELYLTEELALLRPKLQSSLRFEYTLRDRVYALGSNPGLTPNSINSLLQVQGFQEVSVQDITESNYAWYYALKYAPNARHSFSANSVSQLLRVDTRSVYNLQDRDELLYADELAYGTVWNNHFRTGIKASGSYRHIIFINAEQSSENYQERILRLEPSFRWQQGSLAWNGTYSLFVTYNVRDFDSEQDQNRSNRILLTTHNLEYKFNRKWSVFTDFQRRENRLGQLNWHTFRESPLDTTVIYDVNLRGQRSFSRNNKVFRVSLGYRMYRQSRKTTAGLQAASGGQVLIYTNNVTLQHGPKLVTACEISNKLQFSADCWLQLVRIFTAYKPTDTPYVGASTPPSALTAVQRNLFPYFTVALTYNVGNR